MAAFATGRAYGVIDVRDHARRFSMTDGTSPSRPAAKIDTSRPHSARIWNYWLGGKDNN
jgi:hypothetical protein